MNNRISSGDDSDNQKAYVYMLITCKYPYGVLGAVVAAYLSTPEPRIASYDPG